MKLTVQTSFPEPPMYAKEKPRLIEEENKRLIEEYEDTALYGLTERAFKSIGLAKR